MLFSKRPRRPYFQQNTALPISITVHERTVILLLSPLKCVSNICIDIHNTSIVATTSYNTTDKSSERLVEQILFSFDCDRESGESDVAMPKELYSSFDHRAHCRTNE